MKEKGLPPERSFLSPREHARGPSALARHGMTGMGCHPEPPFCHPEAQAEGSTPGRRPERSEGCTASARQDRMGCHPERGNLSPDA